MPATARSNRNRDRGESSSPKRSESSTAIGRAPIAKTSRRMPPTPVAAPWNGSTALGWVCAWRGFAALASPSAPPPALLPLDSADELALVHLGPAPDAEVLRLLVELVVGATARPMARSQATAPERRDVLQRFARRLAGFTRPRPLLVDRPRCDLLRAILGTAL